MVAAGSPGAGTINPWLRQMNRTRSRHTPPETTSMSPPFEGSHTQGAQVSDTHGFIRRSIGLAALFFMLQACVSNPVTSRAIDTLVRLSSERVAVADRVAAAKWGTDSPIENPAREQQVLDDTVKRAATMGVDSAAALRIFRGQIEANKLVQRGLYEYWASTSAGQQSPRPDLANEVRPVLDRIGIELLIAIRDAGPTLEGAGCKRALHRSRLQAVRALHLDSLHRKGLERALLHVCR